MGLLDRLRQRKYVPDDLFAPMPTFRAEYGEQTRFVVDSETLALMHEGKAQQSAQGQFLVLDMLAEEGRATVLPGEGFEVSADEAARLDDDVAAILGLPGRYAGQVLTKVRSNTTSCDFGISVMMRVGAYPEPHERRGPVMKIGSSLYRLSVPMLRSLRAIEVHADLGPEERREAPNVKLVAELQAAKRLAREAEDEALRDPSFHLDLGALDRFSTLEPSSVGITVEPQEDGSLAVEPDLGPGVDPAALRRRWHQLDRPGPAPEDPSGGVLRVDDTIVLLDRERLAGVRAVRRRPRIPAEDVPLFLRAPGSFYPPEVVNLDVQLGVWVKGLGRVARVSFRDATATPITCWFGTPPSVLRDAPATLEELEEIRDKIGEARHRGEDVVEHDGDLISIDHPEQVDQALREAEERLRAEAADETAGDPGAGDREGSSEHADEAGDAAGDTTASAGGDEPSLVDDLIRDTLDELAGLDPADEPPSGETGRGKVTGVGWHLREAGSLASRLHAAASAARPAWEIDYLSLARQPFPHQREAVEWMAGLMHAALCAAERDPERIHGALLADDMGLGKTFMTLVALREAMRTERKQRGVQRPVLAVMPVALLENWLREIEEVFGTRHGPFDDVIVLQGDAVRAFRWQNVTNESTALEDDLDENGMVWQERIGRYAALRVGAIPPTPDEHWEQRRLDRPGRLVLTTYETLVRYQVSLGLVDWSVVILDEAQKTKNPDTLAARAAKALRAGFKLLVTGTPVENSLGEFWCLLDTAQPGLLGPARRFKDEWDRPMRSARCDEREKLGRELRDLVGPFMLRRVKEDHLPDLPRKHTHPYPAAMPPVQAEAYDRVLADHRDRKKAREKSASLKTLGLLRAVSLHPGLVDGELTGDPEQALRSARTFVTIQQILDPVREKGEKAIVFTQTKAMQRALASWLGRRYGLRVDVVNGDTSATGRGDATRLAKIRSFEAGEGFNVIVMSPLAVGVGLTVVGANHAIHLERHWNPAKEAQATDRIYRIGQTREVHVHIPMALHPSIESFDVNLDRLLASKVALKDAVVVPGEVSNRELESALGLN